MTNEKEESIPQKITRTSSPYLDSILGEPFYVLNHGFVRVIDYMGDGASVCQMARVSYGKGTKSVNEDRGVLRYLMRHRHTSPYEGNEIKLHLKMPIFVMRQWIRHRMANVNEYSMRYSEPKDEFYIPELEHIKLQSTDNKQGRGEAAEEQVKDDFQVYTAAVAQQLMKKYEHFNDEELARELNRINLPLTVYTECYWKIDLHNLLHFLKLRCDSHAQYEIRVYADVILNEIVKQWVPDIYEAFIDYIMEAETFSKQEMQLLREAMKNTTVTKEHFELGLKTRGVSKREQTEFFRKLEL